MTEPPKCEALEILAEQEHEQWMRWATTLLLKEDLSVERVVRWNALFRPYSELTESEKDQDRKEAQAPFALLASEKLESARRLAVIGRLQDALAQKDAEIEELRTIFGPLMREADWHVKECHCAGCEWFHRAEAALAKERE